LANYKQLVKQTVGLDDEIEEPNLENKPIIINFDTKDAKEKHADMLNSLLSSILKKRENQINEEDGGGDSEEEDSPANRMGSGKYLAALGGSDERQEAKQPKQFIKMLKKFLKKNQYKKED
jgi:flagellar biogenesis protein FliO